ncbi:hypothetical protein QFC19_001354 [Naganishia cerealis]|uniref:Uncharacterized protein n=1 Tax=Naganishia cerealis TaxID=610337 RepID=A0ACC2WGE3_9TREE|nr:hypothetical protein QFC19_001354 [Naganishia cerealis]
MKEIGLNEDVEKDPLRLADYVELSSDDGRNKLYTCLAEELGQDKERKNSKAIKILSEIPINALWTTNFDTIIERTYENQERKLRALTVNKSILERSDGDFALLYKMHGSIEKDKKDRIVISRSDYDRFAQNKGGFQTMLQSDLISKHFLFLGFSFTDPDLHHILTITAETVRDPEYHHAPRHLAVMKRPSQAASAATKRQHELFLNLLQRSYGIDTIEVGDHKQVPGVLKAIKDYVFMDRILVSGSFPVDTVHNDRVERQRKRVEELSVSIGRLIAEKRDDRPRTLVSGFGLTVGLNTIAGNSGYHYQAGTPDPQRYQDIRPFPHGVVDISLPLTCSAGASAKEVAGAPLSREEVFTRHRQALIKGVGVGIFIGGWKKNDEGKAIEAPGVEEEYQLLCEAGIVPLPIGSSGGMAKRLWQRFKDEDYGQYHAFFNTDDMKSHYEALGKENPCLTPDEVMDCLRKILRGLEVASFRQLPQQTEEPSA